MKTIVINDLVIGSVIKFEMKGEAEISYRIDKKYWGKGLLQQHLRSFWKPNILDRFTEELLSIVLVHRKFLKNVVLLELEMIKGLQMPKTQKLKNLFIGYYRNLVRS